MIIECKQHCCDLTVYLHLLFSHVAGNNKWHSLALLSFSCSGSQSFSGSHHSSPLTCGFGEKTKELRDAVTREDELPREDFKVQIRAENNKKKKLGEKQGTSRVIS